jgi:hypothetical protein
MVEPAMSQSNIQFNNKNTIFELIEQTEKPHPNKKLKSNNICNTFIIFYCCYALCWGRKDYKHAGSNKICMEFLNINFQNDNSD